jgi:hypothetical protein
LADLRERGSGANKSYHGSQLANFWHPLPMTNAIGVGFVRGSSLRPVNQILATSVKMTVKQAMLRFR